MLDFDFPIFALPYIDNAIFLIYIYLLLNILLNIDGMTALQYYTLRVSDWKKYQLRGIQYHYQRIYTESPTPVMFIAAWMGFC